MRSLRGWCGERQRLSFIGKQKWCAMHGRERGRETNHKAFLFWVSSRLRFVVVVFSLQSFFSLFKCRCAPLATSVDVHGFLAAVLPAKDLLLDGQEQLELWGQVLFGIEAVAEVQPANTAIGVNLHAQSLDVVGAVRTTCEVRQVELDLIPAFIEAHRHGTDERLYASRRLVIGGAESSAHTLVVEHGDLECEVLLQVLDDHDEEGQLDAKGFLLLCGAGDKAGVHVATD